MRRGRNFDSEVSTPVSSAIALRCGDMDADSRTVARKRGGTLLPIRVAFAASKNRLGLPTLSGGTSGLTSLAHLHRLVE